MTKAEAREILELCGRPAVTGGHLDPVTALGAVLHREIPKGEQFVDWVADQDGQTLAVQALLVAGFSWEEIRTAMFDLTRQRWLPDVAHLQISHRNGIAEAQQLA